MSHEPGWYRDPTNRFAFRYWDGTRWTPQVGSGQSTGSDPEPLDQAVTAVPPAFGAAAEEARPQATRPTIRGARSGGLRSSAGVIAAVVVVMVAVVILAVVLLGSDGDGGATGPPTPTEAPAEPAATEPPTVATPGT